MMTFLSFLPNGVIGNLLLDIWTLVNEMSPYLLLGFLLAGLMHEFIPHRIYAEYLSHSNLRSVVLAALFGVPLPLCSCGVLPTAMGLRRQGGSRGATVAFLISTPQTGVDSIIATYSLMGLPFAVVRPIVAFVTAILGGELVNMFDGKDEIIIVKSPTQQEQKKSFLEKIKGSLDYAFVEMVGDIGKWLVVGLVVAGMITALVPDAWFSVFKDNSLLSILLVLLISVPMYVCATGSIPIAVALMMKGLTPGAALVLLMAGPACNVASLLVVDKVMGRRTLLLYLLAIVGGAVAFGLGIDYLLPRQWFTSSLLIQSGCCETEELGWFSIACTVVLLLLLINALFFHHHDHHEHDECATDNACHFHIEGMHCSHCASNVEQAIRSVEGVEEVSVSLEDKTAVVVGDMDSQALRKAVESLGYNVAPLD